MRADNDNQRMEQHINPIGAKIKRKVNRHNDSSEHLTLEMPQSHHAHAQSHSHSQSPPPNPQSQKQNQPHNKQPHKEALKQISINISSTKQMPIRSFSKLINVESNSVLNKSYSSGQLANQKCVQHVRKINQGLRSKIQETGRKIKEISMRKSKLEERYNRLVDSQCSKMSIQIRKLNLNPTTTSNIQHKADQNNEWDSLLLLQLSQNAQAPRILESRFKLSQIRQRATELDTSSLNKFAKEKPKLTGHR